MVLTTIKKLKPERYRRCQGQNSGVDTTTAASERGGGQDQDHKGLGTGDPGQHPDTRRYSAGVPPSLLWISGQLPPCYSRTAQSAGHGGPHAHLSTTASIGQGQIDMVCLG